MTPKVSGRTLRKAIMTLTTTRSAHEVPLMIRTKSYIRPGRRAGTTETRGRAAEYAIQWRPVPERFDKSDQSYPIGHPSRYASGDPRRSGYVKIATSNLIGLLRNLSATELLVIVGLVFSVNRDKHGATQEDVVFGTNDAAHVLNRNTSWRRNRKARRTMADSLHEARRQSVDFHETTAATSDLDEKTPRSNVGNHEMAHRDARRTLKRLADRGLLRQERPPAGRRSTRWRVIGYLSDGLRRNAPPTGNKGWSPLVRLRPPRGVESRSLSLRGVPASRFDGLQGTQETPVGIHLGDPGKNIVNRNDWIPARPSHQPIRRRTNASQ